ncbi:kinase-like domain-containing protein, partial [Vararia minispora EC-137]
MAVGDEILLQKRRDPRIIGQWKVGRKIGQGAIGHVRIARHAKSGQYAAIKILSKSCLQDSEEADSLRITNIEREIVIMRLLNHPNIGLIYDVWETSSNYYIFLEYIDGQELFHYLSDKDKKKLDTEEARRFFRQIIIGLDYCHRHHIVHRDLKLENILVSRQGNVKIVDFGLAAWREANSDGLLRTKCGSNHYMAPEILRGRPYDGTATDVWACGIVLYTMLVGTVPWDDDDANKLVKMILTEHLRIPLGVDRKARDLLTRMIERNPTRRITVPQILVHDFLKPRPDSPPASSDLQDEETMCMLSNTDDIDPALFRNLRTLWTGLPEETTRQNLLSPVPTLEKRVYKLLSQYRERRREE